MGEHSTRRLTNLKRRPRQKRSVLRSIVPARYSWSSPGPLLPCTSTLPTRGILRQELAHVTRHELVSFHFRDCSFTAAERNDAARHWQLGPKLRRWRAGGCFMHD